MGERTGIAWCDHTFNPWRGCTKVSAGCANCYAETLSKRNPAVLGEWGPEGKRVVAAESYWKLPEQWNRAAMKAGVRRRVFCASLADVFENRVELVDPRRRLFNLIAVTPGLDWLLLTKRPENVIDLWPGTWAANPALMTVDGDTVFRNLWLGVSVEDQRTADARIQGLLRIPVAMRFVSYEPALGPVDFGRFVARDGDLGHCLVCGWKGNAWDCPVSGHGPLRFGTLDRGLDWVIVGGESGPKARPFDIDWARSVVEQCRVAGVPAFVKQLGARPVGPDYGATSEYDQDCRASVFLRDRAGSDPEEWPEVLRVREFPEVKG